MSLEGLGLVGRGEGAEFVASGETGPQGRLPVNTHGGLLCEGYLHGMNTVAEAVLQVQGRGGQRQLERHDRCAVTSGALMDGSAMVLARDAA
jgi:acetyl-CoA acetyltransferase